MLKVDQVDEGNALDGDDADDVDDANSEDFDLDYSQTHLEDFLKSQTSNSLMKGSNIQSG